MCVDGAILIVVPGWIFQKFSKPAPPNQNMTPPESPLSSPTHQILMICHNPLHLIETHKGSVCLQFKAIRAVIKPSELTDGWCSIHNNSQDGHSTFSSLGRSVNFLFLNLWTGLVCASALPKFSILGLNLITIGETGL